MTSGGPDERRWLVERRQAVQETTSSASRSSCRVEDCGDREQDHDDQRREEAGSVAAREVLEVRGVEGEVTDALHDPSRSDGSVSRSRPRSPHRRNEERDEQDADVAHEVLVVGAARHGNPSAADRELLEERAREQRGLDADWQHEHCDQHQRPVRPAAHWWRELGCFVSRLLRRGHQRERYGRTGLRSWSS